MLVSHEVFKPSCDVIDMGARVVGIVVSVLEGYFCGGCVCCCLLLVRLLLLRLLLWLE